MSEDSHHSRVHNLGNHWFLLIIFLLSLTIYILTLPRGILPGDSGELIAASRTLSIAHPPGYPLYLLIGNVFSRAVVLGSIAARYNLLSAIATSAMVAALWLLLNEAGVHKWPATAIALSVATLETTWLQGTTAEVYAINGLLTSGLLLAALWGRRRNEPIWLAIGYLGGLSLAHHLTLIYPLGLSAALLWRNTGRPRGSVIVLSALLFIAGLTVWLYIPIRASLGPPLVWGRTDTLSGFLDHVTAQGYRWRLREFAPAGRIRDFLGFFRLAASQFGMPLCGLAAIGAVAGLRRAPLIAGVFILLLLLFGAHFAMYNIPDIASHVFPAVVGIGVLAGMGISEVARYLGPRRRRYAIAGLAVAVIVVYNLVNLKPRKDEWFAGDYATAIQTSSRQACGDDCLLISTGDISTFPVLYLALAEASGIRLYDLAASNPEIIGARERPLSLDVCVAQASSVFGADRIALVGLMPASILGVKPRICGMVSVLAEPEGYCIGPADVTIRGIGADLRDYSSRLLSSSYYLHMARWHAERGDSAGFRDAIDGALQSGYDDVGTYLNAANLCFGNGMIGRAAEIAQQAVNIDPGFFEAHDILANIFMLAGRYDEAIEEYRLALKSNPAPAAVHSNLGNAYTRAGNYRLAEEHFTKALDLDSTLVNAWIGMGRMLEATGNPDRALASYRWARHLDPTSVAAYHAEASLYLRTSRFEDALSILRTALGDIPDNALLLSDMGLYYLRTANLDSSIAYLEQAVGRDPGLLTARGNLAVALEGKGLRERAIQEYRAIVGTAPPGQLRDRASRALAELTGEAGAAGPRR